MPLRRLRGGFSLVELIVVMAIMILISGIVFTNLFSSGQQQKLDAERDRFASALQDARARAIAQEEGSQWSVYVDGQTDMYAVFAGADYGSGTTTDTLYLPVGMEIVSPTGTTTVAFTKGSGTTTAATFVIGRTADQSSSSTISVSAGGAIAY
ncbi:MAG: prepilin-type N-terminal cleavage/methylation domain-containing protein [Candidatus Liptonbacteria bacterium]|nr:prepilin-type N-terminal cleavage/methylation domain-containing protein [Candidatus Liptonbacteria bacterium]